MTAPLEIALGWAAGWTLRLLLVAFAVAYLLRAALWVTAASLVGRR